MGWLLGYSSCWTPYGGCHGTHALDGSSSHPSDAAAGHHYWKVYARTAFESAYAKRHVGRVVFGLRDDTCGLGDGRSSPKCLIGVDELGFMFSNGGFLGGNPSIVMCREGATSFAYGSYLVFKFVYSTGTLSAGCDVYDGGSSSFQTIKTGLPHDGTRKYYPAIQTSVPSSFAMESL